MAKYTFYKQKEDITEIIPADHDEIQDWQQDPKGYFLIRLNKETGQIEVGFVKNDHIITKKIIGKNATEIYHTIIKKRMVQRLEHAAYLGKELYKAELSLKYGWRYIQDLPLRVMKN